MQCSMLCMLLTCCETLHHLHTSSSADSNRALVPQYIVQKCQCGSELAGGGEALPVSHSRLTPVVE